MRHFRIPILMLAFLMVPDDVLNGAVRGAVDGANSNERKLNQMSKGGKTTFYKEVCVTVREVKGGGYEAETTLGDVNFHEVDPYRDGAVQAVRRRVVAYFYPSDGEGWIDDNIIIRFSTKEGR